MEAKHNHVDTSALHALRDKAVRKLRAQDKPKTARKATVVDEPEVTELHAATPSVARQGVAVVAWLLSYASAFYGAITLLDSVVVAAMALTSSQFMLFLVVFIGFVVALIAAASAATLAYNAVMAFDAGAIKRRVVSWRDGFDAWREERAAKAKAEAIVDMEDALRAGL